MPGIEKPTLVQTYPGGMVKCPRCNGDGVIAPPDYSRARLCPDCRGTGLLHTPESLPLDREPDTSREN